MTANKFYKVLIGLLVLLIIGTGGMLYFGNVLMQKSASQLIKIKLDNIGYDSEEQTFLQARKDLEKYSELNSIIQKVLPKSKDQAQAVTELYKIGDETNIIIESIQFPSSNLGQKTAAPTTSSNTNTPAVAAVPTNTVTQAKAVEGMPGVMGIDITVGLLPKYGKSINYDDMIKFLQKVELNRRNMQIKSITVHADTKNGGITFEVTLTIFVKP